MISHRKLTVTGLCLFFACICDAKYQCHFWISGFINHEAKPSKHHSRFLSKPAESCQNEEERQLKMANSEILLMKNNKITHEMKSRYAKQLIEDARCRLSPIFEDIDRRTQKNIEKILSAFRDLQVGSGMFSGVDGYGHGDIGRDVLDEVFARVLGAESALVRVQCFSGTHAIACSLFGVLRPGQTLLSISGAPYDTLEEVIGTRQPKVPNLGTSMSLEEEEYHYEEGLIGNLKEWMIGYSKVDLTETGLFDVEAIDEAIGRDPSIKVLAIQRSCGYSWRPSLQIKEIQRVIQHIRQKWQSRDLIIFVDNCYGELVEDLEPTQVGADLMAGSLIKNLGGTIARSGGYIAGKKKYVQAAMNRLSAPGVAGGANLGQNRNLYQGLFLAPTIVGEALKGANLVAEVLGNEFGCPCNPVPQSFRTDIIQAVQLGSKENLVAFCKCVQRYSPVGAYIDPIPGKTPGYGDEVIFADGTFVDGSTLELSADGPLREPFTVFIQGGTHWSHWSIVLENALTEMDFIDQSSRLEMNDIYQETEQLQQH